jgi:hypothetical protein
MSLIGDQGFQHYAWKSTCKINKCKYKASSILKISKCHQSFHYLNKLYIKKK